MAHSACACPAQRFVRGWPLWVSAWFRPPENLRPSPCTGWSPSVATGGHHQPVRAGSGCPLPLAMAPGAFRALPLPALSMAAPMCQPLLLWVGVHNNPIAGQRLCRSRFQAASFRASGAFRRGDPRAISRLSVVMSPTSLRFEEPRNESGQSSLALPR